MHLIHARSRVLALCASATAGRRKRASPLACSPRCSSNNSCTVCCQSARRNDRETDGTGRVDAGWSCADACESAVPGCVLGDAGKVLLRASASWGRASFDGAGGGCCACCLSLKEVASMGTARCSLRVPSTGPWVGGGDSAGGTALAAAGDGERRPRRRSARTRSSISTASGRSVGSRVSMERIRSWMLSLYGEPVGIT